MGSNNTSSETAYLGTLTPLRGFAALGVVLYHASFFFRAFQHPSIVTLVGNGYLWVDFFFVLSGFVLTHVYGDKLSTIDLGAYRSFMVKRIARIYPLHIATLFATLACVNFLGPWRFSPWTSGPDSIWAFVTHIFMLNSVHLTTGLTWNAPAWSIGSEFLTYAILPQILWLAHKKRPIVLWTLYLCSLAALASLIYNVSPRSNLDITWNYGFLRCLVEFFGGVILYNLFLRHRDQALIQSDITFLVALTSLMSALYIDAPDLIIVPAAGFLIVTSAANTGIVKRALAVRPMQYFGDISYSIYLVHWLLLWACYDIAHRLDALRIVYNDGIWGLGAYLIAVIVFADLFYRCLEKPFRIRINRLSVQKDSSRKNVNITKSPRVPSQAVER